MLAELGRLLPTTPENVDQQRVLARARLAVQPLNLVHGPDVSTCAVRNIPMQLKLPSGPHSGSERRAQVPGCGIARMVIELIGRGYAAQVAARPAP